jgi:hypothetical protein
VVDTQVASTVFSTLFEFPPRDGKYFPEEALIPVQQARRVTPEVTYVKALMDLPVVPPTPKTTTGPVREVTFSDNTVSVEKVTTSGPDPEVHMDDWVQTVELPLEEFPIPSGAGCVPPTTTVASGSSMPIYVVASSSQAVTVQPTIPGALTATRTRPTGLLPVFQVQSRGPVLPLGRGQARATVCRPVACQTLAGHPVPQFPSSSLRMPNPVPCPPSQDFPSREECRQVAMGLSQWVDRVYDCHQSSVAFHKSEATTWQEKALEREGEMKELLKEKAHLEEALEASEQERATLKKGFDSQQAQLQAAHEELTSLREAKRQLTDQLAQTGPPLSAEETPTFEALTSQNASRALELNELRSSQITDRALIEQ